MSQEKDDRTLGLSPAQVAGSALAAVSGALLASFAGTTGTIIGTAIGSVVATVGAAIYTASLKRTSDAVRRTAAQVRQTALVSGPLPRTVAQGPLRGLKDRGTKSGPGGEPDSRPENEPQNQHQNGPQNGPQSEPDTRTGDEGAKTRRSLPWGKTLLAAAAVTVIALGGITTFEAVTGRTIASIIGGDDSQGTSVGHFVGSDNRAKKDPEPKDKAPVDKPTQTPEPGTGTTDVPDPEVPEVTPSVPPVDPSDGASVNPEDPEGAPEGGPAADPDADAGAVPNPESP